MKKYIFVLLILAISLITCNNDPGTNSGTPDNPNVNVPTDPSNIPNFDTKKGYTPVKAGEAESFLNYLLNGFLVNTNYMLNENGGLYKYAANIILDNANLKSDGSGRAVQTADVDFTGLFNMPSSVKLLGYIKGTVSADDENVFPITVNGDTKLRLELYDGFSLDEGFEVIGYIAGSAEAKNARINENSASGSLAGTINCAVNVGASNKWAKLTINADFTSNLSSDLIAATADIKVYGDGSDELASKAIRVEITPDGITVK